MGEDGGFCCAKLSSYSMQDEWKEKIEYATKQTPHYYKYVKCNSFYINIYKISIAFLPPYLTLDFSDVPTLLATFTFGPLAGVIVALVKIY